MLIIFWSSFFVIFWAMIGYPIFLLIMSKIVKRNIKKDYSYEPTVTVMVVAHNEEKVIKRKLDNIASLDYPVEKISLLIASDHSTDATNQIVQEYINDHPTINMVLYETKERKGKTNAQNEAQKLVTSDILVMTDANAILKKNAVKELVASFVNEDIVYVSGCLIYENVNVSNTSENEGNYWSLDLKLRDIESRIQTITAGNGAIYACRNDSYYDFNPIKSHDSAMPLKYALDGKRCIFNKHAIAVEKAGETNEDEFNRKVRMNRDILYLILPTVKLLNIFKYKWFTLFYFGHRSCRYLLWLAHIVLILSNIIICILNFNVAYIFALLLQMSFWISVFIGRNNDFNNSIISICNYYGMTVYAQLIGVINIVTGKAKPIWEKAESTR